MRVVLAAKILRLLCRAGQGRLLVATVPKAEPTSRTSWWGDVFFTSTGISFFLKIICESQIAKYPPLGKPFIKKSAVFFNIVQKAFDPPPFRLNICPILQGVLFKTRF